MQKNEPTSAGWKWDRGYHEEGDGYSELLDKAGKPVVASCDGCAIIMDGPNVKLIEAAPELLEALKGVVRVADRQTVEFEAARAAIAKAEGGQ